MTLQIGVDGGGTKTECILVDATGTVVSRITAPGSNPSLIGPERAQAVLREALRALIADHPGAVIRRTLLCLAGNQALWRETAASLVDVGEVEVASDSLPVLELATSGVPGLALHAGTGSFLAARAPDGTLHYAGGLGWRFGDAASGYDIGCRGIGRALLEMQGWAPTSDLTAALCAYTGLTGYTDNSRHFYAHTETGANLAGFASIVVDLAGKGCEAAQQIIAESISGFAPLMNAVLGHLFPAVTADAPVPCGASGILLNRAPCFSALRSLAGAQAWPIQLQPVTGPPIEGVRRLLLRPK